MSGRSLGFHESIRPRSSNSTSRSPSRIVSIFLDFLGFCTHCSKRRSHDQISDSLLKGFPASSYHLDRFSHFAHQSGGMGPCSSICCAVISSCGARNPSISDLWAKSSNMTQPRLQMSEAYVRGVDGSKNASGGRRTSGVCDSNRDRSLGRKATPKSLSNNLASLMVIELLGAPIQTAGTAYEGTPGSVDAACVSRRTTGSCSGFPYCA